MTAPTRWWWIRHGPVHNPDRRLYGQQDLDCHFPDAARLAALGAALPAEAVWVTSHLARARRTAEVLAEALAVHGIAAPPPAVHEDLAEQHFGDWQGLTFAELTALGPPFERLRQAPGETRPPAGESFADVLARVRGRVAALTEAHAGRDIVAVAHGGTIRAALALALGLDAHAALSFRVDTLSLTRIDYVPPTAQPGPGSLTRWRVEGVNLAPGVPAGAR